MKKKTSKVKKVSPEVLAQTYKVVYESFLRAGFTTDQSFQLLLVVLKR